MAKLTEAQRRVLSQPIFEHFDVYSGYWFTNTEDGGGDKITTRTINALFANKFITRGTNERMFPGRQRCQLPITEAGRRALDNRDG